ncbi:MAG: hypothetical protein WCW26_05135 [Candidatus Buchananbacteria bacterium]
MTNKKFLALLLISVFSLTLVGCGKTIKEKAVEKYLEQAPGIKNIDLEENKSMTITDDQGNVISNSIDGSLPPNWPKEVPYYQKGKIETASSMPLPNGNMLTIGLNTSDSANEISAFYKTELIKLGWKIDSESTFGSNYLLVATKDKYNVRVGINKEEAKEGLMIIETLSIEK